MKEYRKKPVVIEAVQFTGVMENAVEIVVWIGGHGGIATFHFNQDTLTIVTLVGDMNALPGDWIIKDVKDEFYPCKPDIFDATYEPV